MIKLTKVSKEYRDFKALNNVSLEIKKGEFVSILGPSGSGKSTLMHIMGGLDRPTSGKAEVNEQNLAEMKDRALARFRNKSIGFVFQSFYLIPQVSALDNVLLPLIYSQEKAGSRRRKAAEVMKQVGLSAKLKNRPNQLSGGEQQRVAIARALVNDPEIIFADEPTGNLDSKTGRQIFDILRGLNREGKTVIMVTHEIELAKKADRIIRIKDGSIA